MFANVTIVPLASDLDNTSFRNSVVEHARYLALQDLDWIDAREELEEIFGSIEGLCDEKLFDEDALHHFLVSKEGE